MTNIYIVSCGEYSDRHTVAVFSEEVTAKEAAKTMSGDVEKFTLNPTFISRGEGMGIYTITSKPGSVEIDSVKLEAKHWDEAYAADAAFGKVKDWGCDMMETKCFARDEAHAIKIAADRFRQFIAENGTSNQKEKS